jgi:hypothetical protein
MLAALFVTRCVAAYPLPRQRIPSQASFWRYSLTLAELFA